MTQIHHENKSHHCMKIHCSNLVSSKYHPIWYSNGLCERHFFEIDLLPNNIDQNLNKKSKVKKSHSINQPLRDDIRKTCEIFDGHQWQIIEQNIDHISRTTHKNNFDLMATKNLIENNLLKIFQLIENYQIIQKMN